MVYLCFSRHKALNGPKEKGRLFYGALYAWLVLGRGLSWFSLSARSSGGAEGGWGAKSPGIGLLQWLALSGPDIRLVIVKPKLIAQEKAAFKSISMLNWACVYDMSCPPLPRACLLPPSPSPSLILNTPLPPFHSRVVEQDPGEIIELQLWNRLNSVSTEQSGAAACWTSSWAALTTLSVWGGKVEWRGRGGRGLREVPLHY